MKLPAVLADAAALILAAGAAAAATGTSWCLGFGSLGPVRTGMNVKQVMTLTDLRGSDNGMLDCWYLSSRAGDGDFHLMIVKGVVVRIEIRGASPLRTFSGAHLGSSEQELRDMYGSQLESQPHKYDPEGHVFTLKASDGSYGLRFETSHGKVTAIQSGPWEHLHYVEGCS